MPLQARDLAQIISLLEEMRTSIVRLCEAV